METIKNIIFSTPLLRVLCFILQNSSIEISDTEIIKKVEGAKRAAIHQALTRLNELKIIYRTRKGRRCYNKINPDNAWLTPFKITINLLEISPLIDQMKTTSIKIILFGSRADGTNRDGSDFDLLIITNDSSAILQKIRKSPLAEHLQPIIKSPSEMLSLEKDEPILFKEIQKGVVLWEK